jgi:hypothetical protein
MALIAPGGRVLASVVDSSTGAVPTLKKAQEDRAKAMLALKAVEIQCSAPYARGITATTAQLILWQLVEHERCHIVTIWSGHDEG